MKNSNNQNFKNLYDAHCQKSGVKNYWGTEGGKKLLIYKVWIFSFILHKKFYKIFKTRWNRSVSFQCKNWVFLVKKTKIRKKPASRFKVWTVFVIQYFSEITVVGVAHLCESVLIWSKKLAHLSFAHLFFASHHYFLIFVFFLRQAFFANRCLLTLLSFK